MREAESKQAERGSGEREEREKRTEINLTNGISENTEQIL
jgi:hypothetical protein